MTHTEQIELIKGIDAKCLDLMQTKGADYGSEDKLSNFKQVSGAAKALGIDITTQEGYAMFMMLVKMARIVNLKAKNATPNHESLLDSYEDLVNYAKLTYLCEIDSNNNEGSV